MICKTIYIYTENNLIGNCSLFNVEDIHLNEKFSNYVIFFFFVMLKYVTIFFLAVKIYCFSLAKIQNRILRYLCLHRILNIGPYKHLHGSVLCVSQTAMYARLSHFNRRCAISGSSRCPNSWIYHGRM